MKQIDSEHLIEGNYYYIQVGDSKQIGCFSNIFN